VSLESQTALLLCEELPQVHGCKHRGGPQWQPNGRNNKASFNGKLTWSSQNSHLLPQAIQPLLSSSSRDVATVSKLKQHSNHTLRRKELTQEGSQLISRSRFLVKHGFSSITHAEIQFFSRGHIAQIFDLLRTKVTLLFPEMQVQLLQSF